MAPDGTMAALHDILFGRAWGRVLPEGAVVLLGELLIDGPCTRGDLDERMRRNQRLPDGLESSPWDPLHDWTDEELRRQALEFGDPDEPVETAEQARADEAERRHLRVAEFDSYQLARGLEAGQTYAHLLALLESCRVVSADDSGRLVVNPHAPLPEEVLPLSAEEAATQARLRWEQLYERNAQRLIALFDPDGERLPWITSTLTRLSRRLDADEESVREALGNLLAAGDFTSDQDVATLVVDDEFTLSVDWPRFDSTRVSIQFGSADDSSSP